MYFNITLGINDDERMRDSNCQFIDVKNKGFFPSFFFLSVRMREK